MSEDKDTVSQTDSDDLDFTDFVENQEKIKNINLIVEKQVELMLEHSAFRNMPDLVKSNLSKECVQTFVNSDMYANAKANVGLVENGKDKLAFEISISRFVFDKLRNPETKGVDHSKLEQYKSLTEFVAAEFENQQNATLWSKVENLFRPGMGENQRFNSRMILEDHANAVFKENLDVDDVTLENLKNLTIAITHPMNTSTSLESMLKAEGGIEKGISELIKSVENPGIDVEPTLLDDIVQGVSAGFTVLKDKAVEAMSWVSDKVGSWFKPNEPEVKEENIAQAQENAQADIKVGTDGENPAVAEPSEVKPEFLTDALIDAIQKTYPTIISDLEDAITAANYKRAEGPDSESRNAQFDEIIKDLNQKKENFEKIVNETKLIQEQRFQEKSLQEGPVTASVSADDDAKEKDKNDKNLTDRVTEDSFSKNGLMDLSSMDNPWARLFAGLAMALAGTIMLSPSLIKNALLLPKHVVDLGIGAIKGGIQTYKNLKNNFNDNGWIANLGRNNRSDLNLAANLNDMGKSIDKLRSDYNAIKALEVNLQKGITRNEANIEKYSKPISGMPKLIRDKLKDWNEKELKKRSLIIARTHARHEMLAQALDIKILTKEIQDYKGKNEDVIPKKKQQLEAAKQNFEVAKERHLEAKQKCVEYFRQELPKQIENLKQEIDVLDVQLKSSEEQLKSIPDGEIKEKAKMQSDIDKLKFQIGELELKKAEAESELISVDDKVRKKEIEGEKKSIKSDIKIDKNQLKELKKLDKVLQKEKGKMVVLSGLMEGKSDIPKPVIALEIDSKLRVANAYRDYYKKSLEIENKRDLKDEGKLSVISGAIHQLDEQIKALNEAKNKNIGALNPDEQKASKKMDKAVENIWEERAKSAEKQAKRKEGSSDSDSDATISESNYDGFEDTPNLTRDTLITFSRDMKEVNKHVEVFDEVLEKATVVEAVSSAAEDVLRRGLLMSNSLAVPEAPQPKSSDVDSDNRPSPKPGMRPQ